MTKLYQIFRPAKNHYVSSTTFVFLLYLLISSTVWALPTRQNGTTAGLSQLDCVTPTFGSISYNPTELYQGNPVSLTSTITGLIPNVSQTFVYTIDDIEQTPVTVTSDADGNVINPLSALENLGVAQLSVGTHVVAVVKITINSCSLVLATGNSVTLTVKPAPDLSPVIYTALQNGTSVFTVVVEVYELNSSPTNTNSPLRVRINKQPQISLILPAGAMSVGGRMVQNSAWSLDDSDEDFYILTANTGISAGDILAFGLTGTFTSGSTSGILSVISSVEPLSGGELLISNNSDSDRIAYFAQ